MKGKWLQENNKHNNNNFVNSRVPPNSRKLYLMLTTSKDNFLEYFQYTEKVIFFFQMFFIKSLKINFNKLKKSKTYYAQKKIILFNMVVFQDVNYSIVRFQNCYTTYKHNMWWNYCNIDFTIQRATKIFNHRNNKL